jgi:hypothetical protein
VHIIKGRQPQVVIIPRTYNTRQRCSNLILQYILKLPQKHINRLDTKTKIIKISEENRMFSLDSAKYSEIQNMLTRKAKFSIVLFSERKPLLSKWSINL